MDFNKYWMWRKFWYFHFVQQKQSKDRSCYKIEKKVKLLFNKYLFVLFKNRNFYLYFVSECRTNLRPSTLACSWLQVESEERIFSYPTD